MVIAFLLPLLIAAPPSVPIQSCAWVRAENDGAGSGFVVDVEKRLLVTCRHLVADRKKVDVIFPWFRAGELLTDRGAYLGNRIRLRELGLLVTGKVLKTSDEYDLALVELESLPAETIAVTFAAHSPSPGELLCVVGNRLDLDTVWNLTTGPVRSHGLLADGYFWRGKKLAENAAVLVGQLPTEEGDSGGPVFDSRGQLVGMASALRRQCPLAAVCISATAIRTFCGIPDAPKEKPKPSPIADTLIRGTVWVRPTATDARMAGVLIEPDLVLTVGKGFTPGDRVGIALPVRNGDTWNAERATYHDPLDLQLRGNWRAATVLARDTDRDLALLKLDSPANVLRPVPFASRPPTPGDAIHTMNHPAGLEFAWVYSGGSVRQCGKVAITLGENARKVNTLLCQLPAQVGSPGGPVLNDRGELVGILSAKESAHMVAYAVTAEEIAAFLDVSLLNRAPRTLPGLFARLEAIPDRLAAAAATGFARDAEEHRTAGRIAEAKRDSDTAVSLGPGCALARLCRAKMLPAADALAELDVAVERGPFDRDVLFTRAGLATDTKDWRKARGDLERILHVNPSDADARQRLIGVLMDLGEDAKAAAAVADTLRADPKRLPAIAANLLSQADTLAKKFPDVPSIPADWLLKAMTAAKRTEFADVLKRAGAAKEETEKLAVLRDGLAKIK